MLHKIVHFDLLYYIQNDVICILILLLLLFATAKLKERTADQKLFQGFLWTTIAFSISDVFTWVLDGVNSPFAFFALQLSNIVFFTTTALIGALWTYYVLELVHLYRNKVIKRSLAFMIPFVLFIVFVAFNPLHELLWKIDGTTNVYSRGPLIWIHWVIVACYVIIPALYLIHIMYHEMALPDRKQYIPLLISLAIPILSAVLQALFYGVALLQIGMTIEVIITYIRQQNEHAYIDELTGVYNRRYLNRISRERYNECRKEDTIFQLMIDIDHFKNINDTYGHQTGDNVLKTMGWVLRTATSKRKGVISARYGGDEFVVTGTNLSLEELNALILDIQLLVEEQNKLDDKLQVTISIGTIYGTKSDFESSEDLLTKADAEMYKIKKERALEETV